ncbi:MAG: hypothetical protein N4A33_06830 [Bacteriovoracaceae bacterium]|jgi:hypothetical protein|nr:hypothetical protein [Bacteriovoracaceae bacterium]
MKLLLFLLLLLISNTYANCGLYGTVKQRLKDCNEKYKNEKMLITKQGLRLFFYNQINDTIYTQKPSQGCKKPFKKKKNLCVLKHSSRFYLTQGNIELYE